MALLAGHMSISFLELPIPTIEKALAIRIQIEALNASLVKIIGGGGGEIPSPFTPVKDGRKGKRSPATIARMKAAQKARWAAKNAAVAVTPAVKGVRKKRRTMSPEARARIAAAQRARWAKQRKA